MTSAVARPGKRMLMSHDITLAGPHVRRTSRDAGQERVREADRLVGAHAQAGARDQIHEVLRVVHAARAGGHAREVEAGALPAERGAGDRVALPEGPPDAQPGAGDE